MHTEELEQQENRMILMIGQFLILLFCFIYLNFIYYNNIRPDQNASSAFSETQCFIMSKKLSDHQGIFKQYRADFLISYNAGGTQYSRWVSANGLDASFSRNIAVQEKLLSQYQVGSNYSCWYDPEDPSVAILAQRQSWYSVVGLLVPAMAGLAAFLYLLLSGKQLWNDVRQKRVNSGIN